MEKCRQKADFRAKFLASSSVRQGKETPSFKLASVKLISATGFRVYRNLVGLTEAEFETTYKKKPKECGIRLHDLPNEHGRTYRGVLLLDPEKPGLRYEVFSDTVGSRSVSEMAPDTHLFSGQDTVVYEAVVADMQRRGSALRKCALARRKSIV